MKKINHQFIVLFGDMEGPAEEVDVLGVFKTFDDARSFIVDEYKSVNPIDDEDEEMNPDLDFDDFCTDGHSFWKIVEV